MFRWLFGDTVTLSGEEARTAILALRRSAKAFDMAETMQAQQMRASRELKLASRIGDRLT